MNERLTTYLAEAGIEVVGVANSGRSMAENASLDDETGIALAMSLSRELLSSDAAPEAIVLPGGRWITIGAVRDIEREFGRPVLTNHTASLWSSLHDAHHVHPIRGWGRLLESLGQLQ
jgi:maleate cis-trans isomerase